MHIFFSLLVARAFAQASYPEQVFRSDGVERVEISGVRGRVTLRGENTSRYRLRVRHSLAKLGADWGLSVERRGSTLVLEVYNVAWGAEWKKILKRDQWPAFDLELSGPSKPATVGWRDGAVIVSDWRANLDVSLLSGPIVVTGGAGRASLQASRGDVKITRFNGDLAVRGEDGTLALTQVNGTTQLNWFSGEVTVDGLRGKLNFEGERARVRGKSLRGRMNFSLTNGAVALSDVGGVLRGEGVATAWSIAARPLADVAIRSGKGAVVITPLGPTDLDLASKAGVIGGAQSVRRGDRRVAKGRWGPANATRAGHLMVRTESGPVRLLN